MERTQGLIEHLVSWLRAQLERSGQKGFVVGVSGGVDSAVTSALCARTGLPTICLEIPILQAQDQVERGRAHTQALAERHPLVQRYEIDLTILFAAFASALRKDHPEKDDELALVNTRSRLRLSTLYYFATVHDHLVVGTGNKVEQYGVGFFAKYGDGGMDLSPIGGLLKSEVYALARALEVDQRIIIAPPTDGLWDDGRTDLDQIGATYPELEWAMDLREGTVDTSTMDLTPRQREVLRIYDERHNDNRHKVAPPPIAPIPLSLRTLPYDLGLWRPSDLS